MVNDEMLKPRSLNPWYIRKEFEKKTGKLGHSSFLGSYASCLVASAWIQKHGQCALIPRMRYDSLGTRYSPQTHMPDYVRSRTLELIAEMIERDNIDGSLAEVGVYKGHFSGQMNALLPSRKLYLFDTFEGFDESDKKRDNESGFISGCDFVDKAFKDTNIDLVLSKMITPDMCVVKKGYFPESADNIEDTFALVSLDCDLYEPMYAGLEYFYPRLAKGGFMMLHEYNCPGFRGVKPAVADYEKKYGQIPKIPIADWAGTLVITK